MTKLIAEIGWNHLGNVSLAKKMILAAKKNGASFAKFQIFNEKNLKPGPWDSDGRRNIYRKAQMTEKKQAILYFFSKKNKIKYFASVNSIDDANLLLKVSNSLVKIPSMESRNINLIKYCVKKFKKIFLSTGTSNLSEVKKIVKLIPKNKLILMHCVSSYPCNLENINLLKIKKLKKLTKNIGFSDHTLGILACKVSLEFNPLYIEKHFTINKKLPGRDNKFAILPSELKEIHDYIIERKKTFVWRGNKIQNCEREVRKLYSGRWSLNID